MEPCWWRNRYMNCCDDSRGVFVLQETEYGLCFTFNSVLNSIGQSHSVISVNEVVITNFLVMKYYCNRKMQLTFRGELQASVIGVVYALMYFYMRQIQTYEMSETHMEYLYVNCNYFPVIPMRECFRSWPTIHIHGQAVLISFQKEHQQPLS